MEIVTKTKTQVGKDLPTSQRLMGYGYFRKRIAWQNVQKYLLPSSTLRKVIICVVVYMISL